MSSQKIIAVEKDLEKFIKFLAIKSAQVIVQSRLGEKMQTQCNPLATGSDWFNIVIHDHPDVYSEIKKALSLAPGQSILQRLPICVEISLKTVEGDQMVLEVWSMDVQKNVNQRNGDDRVDGAGKIDNAKGPTIVGVEPQTLKAAHSIYNRMGVLLKSLVSLTRTTPGYKLSRRQCPDSYGIYYRIYVDRPQEHNLGEGRKNVRIGQLNTIVGLLSMSVAYRTKMTITPSTINTDAMMVKSDHFRPIDAKPTQYANAGGYKKGPFNERRVIDIDKPMRPGAFTDLSKLKQYTDEDYILPETPPFEWLMRRTRNESNSSMGDGSIDSLNRKSNESPVASPSQTNNNSNGSANINSSNGTNKNINNNNNNNIGKSNGTDDNSQKSPTISNRSQSSAKSLFVFPPPSTRHGSVPTLQQMQPPDDDNLLKELHFPFASPKSQVNDLAKFYRDCYNAPPLKGLTEIQTEINGSSSSSCGAVALSASGTTDATTVDDLSRQLEQFETSLEDYDKLVSQLNLTNSSSTGSRSSGGLQMSN